MNDKIFISGKNFILFLLVFPLLLTQACISSNQVRSVVVWHSMDSVLGQAFNKIVDDYNALPETIARHEKVTSVYKGSYDQVLDAVCTVQKNEETQQVPHIAQIFEMGTLVMLKKLDASGKPLFKPLYDVMSLAGKTIDEKSFLPTIAQFYQARTGRLQSLPFNSGTVVMFYNKTKFDQLGLKPPTMWEDVERLAPILKADGAKNVVSVGWPHGHWIDQIGARHNKPLATHGNGVDSDEARLCLHSPFFIKHVESLQQWYKNGWLALKFGPDAETAFAAQEIFLLGQGANRLPIIQAKVKDSFEIGVTFFPYWQRDVEKPSNTIAGGASFWALAGHDEKTYQAIAHFFEYLVSVDVQMAWHLLTGYIPIVHAAHEQIKDHKEAYQSSTAYHAALVAFESLLGQSHAYSRGILLPQFPKIREVMLEQLIPAIKGEKSASDAFEAIDRQGNAILESHNS